MAERIKATWRDLHDLESFRNDFDRLTSADDDSEREQLRSRLARQWGLLYQPVYSVRGARGIVVGTTIATQDVVDTAINSLDHPYYNEAVPAARAHLDMAMGAMERELRDDGPHLPSAVRPIYEEVAKRPVRSFLLAIVLFLAAIATVGQFVIELTDHLVKA